MGVAAQRSAELIEMLRACQSCLDGTRLPEPAFEIGLGWSRTYDEALAGAFHETTRFDQVLRRAFASGRALIVGGGGSGKTVALHRLAQTALSEEVVAITVDLKVWRSSDYEDWAAASKTGLAGQLELLLQRYACPATTPVQLDLLPVDSRKLLVIDGLSEVRGGVGAEIIQVANEFARAVLNSAVIIADRLVRRELPDARRWHLARVLPLEIRFITESARQTTGDVSQQVFEQHAELRTAYFVDLFLRRPGFDGSAVSMRDFFIDAAGISEVELRKIGCVSLELFDNRGARSFAADDLRNAVGDSLFTKLRDSGLVAVEEATRSYFSHHLWHEFLAAYCMAHEDAYWTWERLQQLTLGASSFDSISFILELLPTQDDADRFVRLVYDWNPYAAGYAIAHAKARGGTKVSASMEFVMLAVLAEKRFDVIEATARRAEDGLRVSGTPEAADLLRANDLGQVIELAGRADYPAAWFKEWQRLFCAPIGSLGTDEMYVSVDKADSLMGWTAANVVKRLSPSAHQLQLLLGFLTNGSFAVRWRACHALGAFPSPKVAGAIASLLADDNEWVRFGATRTLVELAVRGSQEIREGVCDLLLKSVPAMDVRSRQELRRTLLISSRSAPKDWIRWAGPLLEELHATADIAVERSEIEHVLLELQGRDRKQG